MEKRDKIITIFYLILGVSFISSIIYVDGTFDKSTLPDVLPAELTEVIVDRTFSSNVKSIFLTFTNVEKYPVILPNNVISVQIINRTNNSVITNSTIMEKGIKTTLIVKHIIEPYDKHTIEVLSGDAKGTTVEQVFEGNSTYTVLKTKIHFKLNGILSTFLFIPKTNIIHAMNTVIDEFIYYSNVSLMDEKKVVDDLYREILFRPADINGLELYTSLLKENKITIEEIRNQLLESDEAKSLLKPNEWKNFDELKPETINLINKLYQEVLNRHADPYGLQYFGSLLESGKISEDNLKYALLHSEEKKSIEKSTVKYFIKKEFSPVPFETEYNFLPATQLKTIDELRSETKSFIFTLYEQRLNRHADPYGLQYFGSLLESGKISEKQLNQYFLQLNH